MANTITDVAGDNRISMSNAKFARPLPAAFLSGWSKIRIALHIAVTDSGADLTGTPRFGIGLCSGGASILGDATTTHWVGFITNAASWTRATAPTRYSQSDSRAAVRIGSTLTVHASDGIGADTWFSHSSGNRSLCFVDITKGSPNFSVQLILYRNSNSDVDVSDANFLTQSATGVPSFLNHAAATLQTIAVSEGTNGTLDHVNVWFDQSAAVMRIANLRVYRLA